MKKIIAFSLFLIMIFTILTGCGVKTKKDVTVEVEKDAKPIEISILAFSLYEKDVNILRDQLSKAGYDVKISIQPDWSSFTTQEKAGNYDIAISGWTAVTANPDYAVRPLFSTGADYNSQNISNPDLDKLINEASTQNPKDYVETYKQFEKILVEDNAYILPLYSSLRIQGFNKEILKPDTVKLFPSRSMNWEGVDFVDQSKRDKEPLILSQLLPNLTSLDPIKGNDGSINTLNTNMYIRLVNLDDKDKITSAGSLSYNHAIAEGNQVYYFVLRDDVKFAKVNNKKAVDSGELVAAEDVVFTMNRAKDKNSVPDHRTYSLHGNMDKIEILTDISELDGTISSNNGASIKAVLENGLPSPIKELTADKSKVSNKNGTYQVVKITTKTPFPQVLNFLAHQSAGIVSKAQVEAVNTYDIATYDRNKDVAYGDQSTVTEGATYNNTLAASGPYIIIQKNDYEVVFQKNPGYMKGTEYEPKISDITVKFIKDMDSSISALRSGEIHVSNVPEDKIPLIEGDQKLELQKSKSNAILFAKFNLAEASKCSNPDLRKAILYTVNQDEFIAVYNNLKNKVYSTISTMVDTGNTLNADPAKAKEYLEKYRATLK